MVTEVLTFQLNENSSLADSSSPAATTIREFLKVELAADGAKQAHFGHFIEKPDTVVIFVGWDSLEAHQKFIKTGDYQTHIKKLQSLSRDEKEPRILHVQFGPTENMSPALSGPKVGATEIVFFYFPSSLTPAEKDAVMDAFAGMRPCVERSESLNVYDGWAIEEDVPNPNVEGETCKVFMNVLGWESVDKHMAFQASEDFGKNIHYLMGLKDVKANELYHAKLIAA